MMASLFSTFDPSNPTFLFSNWTAMAMFILLLPSAVWNHPARPKFLFCLALSLLLKEFKPLIKKSPYTLMAPVALTIFIVGNNLFGLAPYVFTCTTQLVFTSALALPIWLALMIYGWLNNTANMLAHLIPQNTPLLLMPFMVLVETISNMIRPLTLAVRLAANMVAGHLLIVLLSSVEQSNILLGILMLPTKQLLLALELAVAFIQAYVFSVLVTLYAAEFTS